MAIGNWNYTGDYYVSQKFGADTNNGSAATPFASLHQGLSQIDNTGAVVKTLVVKAGIYAADHAYTLVIGRIIGDGGVKIFGGGDGVFTMGAHHSIALELVNVKLDGFLTMRRITSIHSQISRVSAFTLIGARYTTFYDCTEIFILNGNVSFDYYEAKFYHCNFLKSGIKRSALEPAFYNCYFDGESRIFRQSPNNDSNTYQFENCVFHKDFKIEDQTILEYYNDGNEASFSSYPKIIDDSPGFNYAEGTDFDKWDLTLKYSSDPSQRSPLYLGAGMFAGAHKFAIPVDRTHQAFAQNLTTGPYNDEDPIWENVSQAEPTVVIDNTQPGTIRSSGVEGNRLSFAAARTVDTRYRFVGPFFVPDEWIDTDRADDRATYKLRIVDPITGNWLPSSSTWYDIEVNAPWQVDASGKGNGDPAFDISTASYLRCQEYQIELTLNAVNP
ncbi:MAG TPA: hypothetical protein DCE41_32765 [Cytophagales bacterium]|nr:hypothetical protein [Cytophagales bacterium]HAA18089.1 hypothetical protein [Cytophagales bacterium]HAP59874.1 hypothetical protein [Cytophagales bacterium]